MTGVCWTPDDTGISTPDGSVEDMAPDADDVAVPDSGPDGSFDLGVDMAVAPDMPPDLGVVEACGPVLAGCDDGLACTTDTCVDGVCEHVGGTCAWPAERQSAADNLTAIDRPGFSSDLSGIVYNPVNPRLWLVRNNGPSRVWSLVRDPVGAWQIDTQGTIQATWNDFGDAEGITLADWNDEFRVLVLIEGGGRIGEYDFSDFSTKTELNLWDIAELPGSGSEGITFVPDAALTAGGFVDADGNAYTSTEGMGGLVFVAVQGGGAIHVVDLNRTDGTYVYVGAYQTGADESSGLEWDGSTGQLFVWHDASHDQLEIVRLTSSVVGATRRFDTIVTYNGPQTGLGISRNFEGIAVEPISECVDGHRNFYMTTDGGNGFSLFRYEDFSC